MLRASGVDRVLGRHGRELVENGKMEKKNGGKEETATLLFLLFTFSLLPLSLPFFFHLLRRSGREMKMEKLGYVQLFLLF